MEWYRDELALPSRTFRMPEFLLSNLNKMMMGSHIAQAVSASLIDLPTALLAEGWQPYHQSTEEGVRSWAAEEMFKKRINKLGIV